MINWPHIGLYGELTSCEEGLVSALNRNFFIIDSLLQLKVIDFVETLPSSPEEGDIYIVEDSSYTYTSGNSYIMMFNGGNWIQIIPKAGFIAWVESEENFFYNNGSDWIILPKTIGDVSGPNSSLENSIARFDGLTGKFIKSSGVIIDDLNNISGASKVTANEIDTLLLTVSSAEITPLASSLDSPTVVHNILKGSILTLDSVGKPTLVNKSRVHIIENGTDHAVEIKNNATIRTGTGEDLSLAPSASIFLIYSSISDQWIIVGGSGAGSGVIVVPDIASRNAIAENKRTNGMLVQVVSEDQIYKLIGLPSGATTTAANWELVITASNVATITNKDIDGGTASNTSRFTVPKGTASALHALARKEATVLENTESKQLMLDDGTNLNAIPKFGNTDTMFVDIAANEVLAGWTQTFTGSTATLTRSTSTDVAPYAYRLANALSDNLGTLKLTRLVDVPKGFNGQRLNISFDYASTILDGFGLSVYDMTNSAYIIGYDNSDAYKIPAANIPTKANYVFDVPLTCTQIRIELHKKLGFDLVGGVFSFNNTRIGKWNPNVAITEGPKSHIRFGNGGNRGSTNTQVVYFTELAEQSGTGLPYVSTAALGTEIRVLRSGVLTVTSTRNQPVAAVGAQIVKNATTFSTSHPAGTVIAGYSGSSGAGVQAQMSGSTRVVAGDIIRLVAENNTSAVNVSNTFSAVLHEDNLAARYADYTLNQDVFFQGYVSAVQALTVNVTNIIFTTLKDTTGSWTGSTFVVPSSGDYVIQGSFELNGKSARAIVAYVNGVIRDIVGVGEGTAGQTLSGVLEGLKVGDIISLRSTTAASTVINSNARISIRKVATSQQVFTPISQRYIVKTYQSGTSWYEVNNDGWVRQSWRGITPASGTSVFTLPLAMKDNNYLALANQTHVDATQSATPIQFSGMTATQVTYGSSVGSAKFSALVEGYGDSAAVKALGANPNY